MVTPPEQTNKNGNDDPNWQIETAPQPDTRRYTLEEWPPPEVATLATAALEADVAATTAIHEAVYTLDMLGHDHSGTAAAVNTAVETAESAAKTYGALSSCANRLEQNGRRSGAPGFIYRGASRHLHVMAAGHGDEFLQFLHAVEDAREQDAGDRSRLSDVLYGTSDKPYDPYAVMDSDNRVELILDMFRHQPQFWQPRLRLSEKLAAAASRHIGRHRTDVAAAFGPAANL